MKKITLKNVIDVRNGNHYSVVKVEEWKKKYFVECIKDDKSNK